MARSLVTWLLETWKYKNNTKTRIEHDYRTWLQVTINRFFSEYEIQNMKFKLCNTQSEGHII